MRRLKTEKPGLQAAKNRFFGFEKNSGLPGFSVSVKTGLESLDVDLEAIACVHSLQYSTVQYVLNHRFAEKGKAKSAAVMFIYVKSSYKQYLYLGEIIHLSLTINTICMICAVSVSYKDINTFNLRAEKHRKVQGYAYWKLFYPKTVLYGKSTA